MELSATARGLSGLILLTVPTIAVGGWYLLRLTVGREAGYADHPVRRSLFRAGHAHAGVLVLLALVCQVLADGAALGEGWRWVARLGVPGAAVLMSLGFFLAMVSPGAERPGPALKLVYVGATSLSAGVVTLGVGLVRSVW